MICEVLAFIQHKCGSMDEDGLVRICATAFTAEEIEMAKNLLLDFVPTQTRNFTRKREGKAQRDIFVIIYLMTDNKPKEEPVNYCQLIVFNYNSGPIEMTHIEINKCDMCTCAMNKCNEALYSHDRY